MFTINIPYLLGALKTPNNPQGFPERVDFTLSFCPATGRYYQIPFPEVDTLNEKAYELGSLLGTAMDDSLLGASYAKDFFKFIQTFLEIKGKKILEIGCGRGALLYLLSNKCLKADGIEPGIQNKKYWEKFNVNVIPEVFPSKKIKQKYDVVIGFLLLEHLKNLDDFFYNIEQILTVNGSVVFAVPDCAEYIRTGDIGMLIHQHYQYFTLESFQDTLNFYGYKITGIQNANVGSILYIVAEKNSDIKSQAKVKFSDNINIFVKKT